MTNPLAIHLILAAASASDPATQCRQAFAADPPAHIACLERALRSTAQHGASRQPAAPDQFGAESIPSVTDDDADRRPASIAVEIVATRYSDDRGTFEMADGQRWRETEKTPEQLRLQPAVRYQARIERGTLGGYRMYVEGQRRMIKVKRVR